MFSEKHMDVTEKTNIRQFWLILMNQNGRMLASEDT